MENSMAEALKLLLTGMSTVFVILIFVVLLGNLIIIVTNKFGGAAGTLTEGSNREDQQIDSTKLAAIVAAVDVATNGKGNITSIQKSK